MSIIRSAILRWTPVWLLLLSLITDYVQAAEPTNYCQDETAASEWQELLAKYPDDTDIIKLYALRSGLCAMVERDQLPLTQAIDIFEAERLRVITEKQWERERSQPEQGA